jgi:hypothetical protein
MEQLAVLPSWLAQCLLKYNRVRTRTVYGSVGLSMLRDASVFVGPMSDSGFDEGLLANGNVGLTTVSKEKVACITFKGPRKGQVCPIYPVNGNRRISSLMLPPGTPAAQPAPR